jgi:hypothetical protein
MFPRFAVHFINAFPIGLFTVRRLSSREGDFHFQTIKGAAKRNPTRRTRRVTMEAVFAGGDDRCLKLQNGLISQTSGVRHITGDTADGSNQTLVGIHQDRNLMRQGGHD